MTYRDSLSLCLSNIVTFAILPKRVLSFSLLPRRLRRLGLAAHEFQRYMEEMVARERSMGRKQRSESPNLMSALVRASDEDTQAKAVGKPSRLGLTDEEIFGNIFAYNLAGHETTANTIAYALVLLAAHPKYQDWLHEEILHAKTMTEDYDSMFPRLQRCLAVMVGSTSFVCQGIDSSRQQYETLRLYGSIVFIPRAASLESQTLVTRDDGEIVLPPSTAVNINVQALHTDPKTWGADSLSWRPTRWFGTPASDVTSDWEATSEMFMPSSEGSFIPWADGPRICPGQKFSQVEFVAVMATLVGRYRVRPVLRPGQTEEEGRFALLDMVDDSAIFAITLQMNRPGKVALHWEVLP
ncbi:MAG: hypothetical protein Q9223_002485 [Gallowayella weberi]